MSKFKVGDKVKFIGKNFHGDEKARNGMVGFIKKVGSNRLGEVILYVDVDGLEITACDYRWELVVEEKEFDLNCDPWFIRTGSPEKSKQAQEWLFSQGLVWRGSEGVKEFQEGTEYGNFLTNINSYYDMETLSCIMWTSSVKGTEGKATEIILTPITTFDVQYIHPVKETEEQKRIQELEKIIQDAQKALDEYKKA